MPQLRAGFAQLVPSNLIADRYQCLDRHQALPCIRLFQGLAPLQCPLAL